MILNLLRVEQLRVEDMMKRSFAELDTARQQAGHRERAEELSRQLDTMQDISSPALQPVLQFYTACSDYLAAKEEVWSLLLSQPGPGKALAPGRLVLTNYRGLVNVLALVLAVDVKSKQRNFVSLLLRPSGAEQREEGAGQARRDLFLGLASQQLQQPDPLGWEHLLVTLYDENIIEITSKTLKVEPDKIINDVKKREIPRFRGDPPGPAVATAVQQLCRAAEGSGPELLHPVQDCRVQDLDLLTRLHKVSALRAAIDTYDCRLAPDFPDQFERVYGVMSVREEKERCEYLCSEASLSMLPEYHCRIEVLKQMKYIDSNRVVQLKGRVACEMGSNELIITELVFENKLTDRPPEEIAALLSCMVFQQRNCSEPELSKSLKEGVEDIKATATKVGQTQVDCGLLEPVGDYVESFHFGLVEVVHEWARGMPFADITQLTDVQEGVIVRTIQRLDETLRDVKDAARVIGDPVLYQKMDAASTIIKRDIVFAASLYTQ